MYSIVRSTNSFGQPERKTTALIPHAYLFWFYKSNYWFSILDLIIANHLRVCKASAPRRASPYCLCSPPADFTGHPLCLGQRLQLQKRARGGSYSTPCCGPREPPREAEVWVKKWVDYSSKYGLGYCLSNEATGVFFNDSTKICLDPNGFHFDYMERRSADRQDVGKEYTLTEYPKDLQKKVTLL